MKKTRFQSTFPLRTVGTLLFVGALAAAFSAFAEEIYKSVDAQGHVTYSSEPPEEAVETQSVAVSPPPSEVQRQEAVQREKRLQQATEKLVRERSSTDRQRGGGAVKGAENALDRAKAQLEEAKVMRDSDWQGKAGGGRRLKEDYFERVQGAEEALNQAEKTASETRRDQR